MKRSKFICLTLLIAGVIITQTGCSSTPDPIQTENYFLDTTCSMTVYSTSEDGKLDSDTAEEAMSAAWDVCRRLDKTLSKTVELSDVSKVNSAGGQWVQVSDDTMTLVKKAIHYSQLSQGAFDITVGTITDLWDYHSDNPVVPDQATIDEALTHVGYENIQLDGNRIRLTDPKAKLDLGGIAKGYIGDVMAQCLRDHGVTGAIVNLGGNIIALGNKPDGSPFKIGIERPYSDRTDIIGSTELTDQTIVTSGVYERQFEVDGKIYHHILSTETGCPADTDIDAVSIVTRYGHSVDADALSTISLMLGYDRASSLIESLEGVEACFSFPDGTVRKTSGMKFDQE